MVENKSPKDEILFCTPVYVALMKLNIKAPDVVEKICIAEKKSLQEQKKQIREWLRDRIENMGFLNEKEKDYILEEFDKEFEELKL